MKNKIYLVLTACFLETLLSCAAKAPVSSASSVKTSTALTGKVVEADIPLHGVPRQITFVGAKAGEGYFSPDGQKMIFQSEREPGNPFYQMYVMDLQTGRTTRVSPGHGKTTCGWIHPSMKKVLFASTHLDPQWKKKAEEELENRRKPVKGRYSWSFDENYDIFSTDLQGKNIKRLTHEKGYDAEGSYSPDGQWIAFASDRAGYTEKLSAEDAKLFAQDPSYMMDIYIMRADGSGVKRLTTTKGYDGGPFFSADGKKITWRRFAPNGQTAEIYTMNTDGSDQKQITRLGAMSWAPFFHPSGDYLIFGSNVYGFGNFELFIVDAKGEHAPVRVTRLDDFDGLPVFTPDGRHLSWTHRNGKGDSQILMADWNDDQARRLLGLPAEVPRAERLSPRLSVDDVKAWIEYLAQEKFAGRKAGSAEEKIYTQTLADAFKAWGLEPAGDKGTYFEKFEFTSGVSLGTKNNLESVGALQKKYQVSQDFEPLSFSQSGSFREAPVVFVGYGIKAPATDKSPAYDSYEGVDVKGKWVLAFNDIPRDLSAERRHDLNLYARPQHKATVAKNAGAIGILFFNGPLSGGGEKFSAMKFEGALAGGSLAVAKIKTEIAQEFVKKANQDLKSLQAQADRGEKISGFVIPSTYLKADIELKLERSTGLNVLARLKIPGAAQTLMIGAHGDHLGHGESGNSLALANEQGQAHLGADDNASGVAGVMELAHLLANRKTKLKQSVLFAVWSGEEIGVLGSTHWVQAHPKASTEISSYLNMDMIGRYRDRLFVQGIGSGDKWASLIEQINSKTEVPLVTQEDPYLPTDSMALYLGQIPSISFFTGSHADYHSPRDRADLINYEGERKSLEVIANLSEILAASPKSLVHYVKVGSGKANLEGRSFRIYLGTIPDYTQEGIKGVRISGVSKNSPAEKAGLQEKDTIVEFDHTHIENLYDYVYALQSVKPNQETTIKVLRAGESRELKIVPLLKE